MTDEKATGSEAVRVAIQLETDGMAFYEEAAKKTSNEFGKGMFLSLVEEEKRHLQILNEVCKGQAPAPDEQAGVVFKGKITTIFKDVTEDLKKKLESGPDDAEAVKIAMDLEEKGYKFYEKAGEEAVGEAEKTLFKRLAIEENGHWTLLEDTYVYLTDPEQWDLRANPPLLDGG